jgi:hypothetical protein
MENRNPNRIRRGSPLDKEAEALGISVAAIRKAQGKPNPSDVELGTPEFAAVEEAFLRDVLRALGEDPDAPWELDIDGHC